MSICDNLIHPFHSDEGISQRRRAVETLLKNAPLIDGRTMADLLDYFVQLSGHINFYDAELNISDWKPFFQKSTPFTLATIVKFDRNSVLGKFDLYNKLFDSNSSNQSLQLLLHFIFYYSINRINSWHILLKESELPVVTVMEQLIKDKLQQPIKIFIQQSNTASKWYRTKRIDFAKIQSNAVWGLSESDLRQVDENFLSTGTTKRKRLLALRESIRPLLASMLEVIRVFSTNASSDIELSLFPLKEELKKLHTPHLGLLFAFLKLFQHLQSDLNGYTRKHLDYFYQDVLKLKTRAAAGDKAHIIVEIQNLLEQYPLKKGLLVKDGKDAKKAEVLFSLDDEIVANKTEVAEVKTLFLEHGNTGNINFVKGVYMAPDALKADGVKIEFKESLPKNFPSLGAHFSKYEDPEQHFIKPYPTARLGFVLASPVLLLKEGNRVIDITLACELEDICSLKSKTDVGRGRGKSCCEGPENEIEATNLDPCRSDQSQLLPASELFPIVRNILTARFYYVNKELIAEAGKKGISADTIKKLYEFLKVDASRICFCESERIDFEEVVLESNFESKFSGDQLIKVKQVFKPQAVLKILFSGEKEWIEPSETGPSESPKNSIEFTSLSGKQFRIQIRSVLKPDKPAITFYNKEKLKEDLNTEQPLVKIELNEIIRKKFSSTEFLRLVNINSTDVRNCCMLNESSQDVYFISLYHFFRNVLLSKAESAKTAIKVTVCGLKNFVVQNEESVMNVNSPIYPFGTRPDIVDFSVVNPIVCITEAFLLDASPGLSLKAKNYLESLLTPANGRRQPVAKNAIESFLNTKDSSNLPYFNGSDKGILRPLFNEPSKKYCELNQVGPEFYIGSKEVFGKKWSTVRVNLNWKDKPNDFRDYYNAYVVENVSDQIFGLDEDRFRIKLSVLEKGGWKEQALDRKLFDVVPPPAMPILDPVTGFSCAEDRSYSQGILIEKGEFPLTSDYGFNIGNAKDESFDVNTKQGFLKISLREQDFLHKEYAYVLARQMMALGKYPDQLLEGAVYRKNGSSVIVFRNFGNLIRLLETSIGNANTQSGNTKNSAEILFNEFNASTGYTTPPQPSPPMAAPAAPPPLSDSIDDGERDSLFYKVYKILADAIQTKTDSDDVVLKYDALRQIYSILDPTGTKVVEPLEVLIPNEPWTPIIKNISIDYISTATINDIDLIHLYPFNDTYKAEEITQGPTLFPTFCDEGNLFIGLKKLKPGSNLPILFQLAEATADSESEREEVKWYYLDNNVWKELRKGFEVLNDDTNELTTSGIIKFLMPANMTKENTILPKGLHWIRASIGKNSKAISETIGIHPQAVKVSFTNEEANDKMRLAEPLPAQSIVKLKQADTSIKKISQPYESFGGRIPEMEGEYYTRVSEWLRHKGRAIQKFDYERLVLEAFPQIFKAKCINHCYGLNAHTFNNDFLLAPGYVLIAVIPDLDKLKAGQSFEPRVPVSLVDKIEEYLCKRVSPFVRLKVMNPRYEKVHFCLKVKLYPGKDEVYYKAKLQQDLREFLAPWAVGEYDKLSFGQCINRSDIVQFLETRDYIDYILELAMANNTANLPTAKNSIQVCPQTPRSILIAGEVDICIKQDDCEQWDNTEICSNKASVLIDYCSNQDPIIT